MEWVHLGTKLYDCRRWINYRCVLVFMVRIFLHYRAAKTLQDFFQQSALRAKALQAHPLFFAQLTRQFFFRGSSAEERLKIIMQSMEAMESVFHMDALERMYLAGKQPFCLWQYKDREGRRMSLDLCFFDGEVREGAMTLVFRLEDMWVYHVNFWILCDSKGQRSLYIGCHQGSKNGLAVNKSLTKQFFGYRPKNFILFALRILASEIGIQALYAVSNYGFYANNHIRKNRKLRVSYDKFWQECGGSVFSEDSRFYQLPIEEPRKSEDEIPVRKKTVYFKRFAFLDQTEAELRQEIQAHLSGH